MISMNKKIRIGIITFANSDNVGAVLQAFGLQQYLNKNNKVLLDLSVAYNFREISMNM